MIRVSKTIRQELEEVGLIRYRKEGVRASDANLVVANREHVGKNAKSYYVVEEPEILLFLQRYETLNLQKLRPDQVQMLKEKGIINEENIQYPREYKPSAIAFVDDRGQYRCKRIASIMLALGYWKAKKKDGKENSAE